MIPFFETSFPGVVACDIYRSWGAHRHTRKLERLVTENPYTGSEEQPFKVSFNDGKQTTHFDSSTSSALSL